MYWLYLLEFSEWNANSEVEQCKKKFKQWAGKFYKCQVGLMAKTRKREKKLKVKTTTACKYDYKGEK